MKFRLQLWSACLLLFFVLSLSGCNRQSSDTLAASAEAKPEATPVAAASVVPATPAPSQPAGNLPKPDVNGNHVMQYVKEVVAFGPRPPGSTAHLKLEEFILSKLKGVDVEQDRFTAQTPVGKFPINNIIAKFP